MRTYPQPCNREAIFGSRYIPLRNQSRLIGEGPFRRRRILVPLLSTWLPLSCEQEDLVIHVLKAQGDRLQGL